MYYNSYNSCYCYYPQIIPKLKGWNHCVTQRRRDDNIKNVSLKQCMRIRNGFNWLRIEPSCGILWTQKSTSGIHKSGELFVWENGCLSRKVVFYGFTVSEKVTVTIIYILVLKYFSPRITIICVISILSLWYFTLIWFNFELFKSYSTLHQTRYLNDVLFINVFKSKINCHSIMDTVVIRVSQGN
jgi:hypothetical protein